MSVMDCLLLAAHCLSYKYHELDCPHNKKVRGLSWSWSCVFIAIIFRMDKTQVDCAGVNSRRVEWWITFQEMTISFRSEYIVVQLDVEIYIRPPHRYAIAFSCYKSTWQALKGIFRNDTKILFINTGLLLLYFKLKCFYRHCAR